MIAHRGSYPKILEFFAAVQGVLLNHSFPQMQSASTFAHEVVEVRREVSERKGIGVQLFFTGHSSVGLLVQITTFTTEYLKSERNLFLTNNNTHNCYHPHTAVFNNSGCKTCCQE